MALGPGVCVTVQTLDVVHSLIFSSGLKTSAETLNLKEAAGTRHVLEGMWWKQERDVTGFVALSNTTKQNLRVDLEVEDSGANTLSAHSAIVSPHGTKVVSLEELRQLTGSNGGIRVTYQIPRITGRWAPRCAFRTLGQMRPSMTTLGAKELDFLRKPFTTQTGPVSRLSIGGRTGLPGLASLVLGRASSQITSRNG
jgi:hypothetical protein